MALFLIKNKSGNNEVDKNREKAGNGITRDRQLLHLKLSHHVYFFTPIFTTGYKSFRCSVKNGAIGQQIKFVQNLSIRSYIYIEEQFILF